VRHHSESYLTSFAPSGVQWQFTSDLGSQCAAVFKLYLMAWTGVLYTEVNRQMNNPRGMARGRGRGGGPPTRAPPPPPQGPAPTEYYGNAQEIATSGYVNVNWVIVPIPCRKWLKRCVRWIDESGKVKVYVDLYRALSWTHL